LAATFNEALLVIDDIELTSVLTTIYDHTLETLAQRTKEVRHEAIKSLLELRSGSTPARDTKDDETRTISVRTSKSSDDNVSGFFDVLLE